MVRPQKKKIPKALREQVWRSQCGDVFEAKCYVTWCKNRITVFDYEVGHNIPESKGGTLELKNLRPLCTQCNRSMSNHYTIDEWNLLGVKVEKNPVIVGRPSKHALVANVLATTKPITSSQVVWTVPVAPPPSVCCGFY